MRKKIDEQKWSYELSNVFSEGGQVGDGGVVTLDDLKKGLKLWVEKKEMIWDTNIQDEDEITIAKIYWISSDVILDNLYYNYFKYFEAKSEPEYKKIEKDIIENGWDSEYPAKIMMSLNNEVVFWNGSHRINMCVGLDKPILVPCIFEYHDDYIMSGPKGDDLVDFLERIKDVFPNGYLPKWLWEKKDEDSNNRE